MFSLRFILNYNTFIVNILHTLLINKINGLKIEDSARSIKNKTNDAKSKENSIQTNAFSNKKTQI